MKYYLQSAEITLNAKSYEQAALSYEKVGDCYEKMGDPLKASEYYVYAAKTMVAAGKPKSAVNTFERAGVNFLEEAESLLVDKDYSNALSYYGKAAECFIGLGEYAKAGDIFIKKAEAHSKLGQEQLVRECFVLAAENFLKAKDEKSAGYAYKMVGEFDKSSLNYTRYAEKKAKSGDDFQAGEGCILAARSFSSMGEDAKRRDSYNLALWHYGKVLKESHSESKEGIQLLADAAERMGECYVDVSDLHNAEKYLRQAVDLYNKIGNTVGNSLSNAMLSRVRGEFALELGNHSQAMEYFAYSARAFNDLIKSGKFESDFVDYLNQHLDSVQNLIYKIELKPEIDLVVDKSIYAFTDSDILVNGVLYNNGKNNINTITFISHLPEQFTLVKIPPEIKVLKPGESLRVTAELRVKNPGEHVLKPFEIFYRDDKGNKYVKASNESLIYALERPPEDFKNSRMAVEVYVRYANTHIANKNYFYAGDGFKKAAEIYGTFNTDKKTAEYYESAINAYGDYIKSQPLDSEDFVILGFIGDAFWNIAESHESMGNLDGAIKNYRQALSYFEKSNSKVKISFGNALLSKTQAKKSIESGSWEDASELLSKSTEFLSETLKKGGLNATQMKLVDRHMAEVKLLMDKIKETPVVSLSIDVPRTVNAGRGFQMKIVVANPGGLSLKNMKLMVNVPDGFVIENTPAESFDLPPKSSKDFSIDVTASIPGEYIFKPVQLFYNDNKGNGFMRGSSELKITVLRDEEAKAAEEVSADARPEVNVYFKQPERSLVGVKLMLEGVIENTGVVTVNGLRFISSVPQEFEVSEVPEVIKELKGNSKQNISLGVTPLQEGEYTFKPLEMFYRDPHGNRYFKGSSDIKLKVVRPEGKPR